MSLLGLLVVYLLLFVCSMRIFVFGMVLLIDVGCSVVFVGGR